MMWLIEGADAPNMCDMTRSYVCDMTLGQVETSCVMKLLLKSSDVQFICVT